MYSNYKIVEKDLLIDVRVERMKIMYWVCVYTSSQIMRRVRYIHVKTPKKSIMASEQIGQCEE
jgi:hypothetical protein